MQKEIEARLAAGPYRSVDELLREALRALDHANEAARELLERELLRGLEGPDIEMNPADWERIEQEALKIVGAKKPAVI